MIFDGNIEALLDYIKNNGYPNAYYNPNLNIHGSEELFLYSHDGKLFFRGFEISLGSYLINGGYDIKILNKN